MDIVSWISVLGGPLFGFAGLWASVLGGSRLPVAKVSGIHLPKAIRRPPAD